MDREIYRRKRDASHGLKEKRLQKKFRFGPGKIHKTTIICELPIVVKNDADEEIFLEMEVYEVDAMVPMLYGLDTMKNVSQILMLKIRKW